MAKTRRIAMLAATTLLLAACSEKAAEQASTGPAAAETDPIKSAMNAAPEALAKDAAVVSAAPDGTMQTLREGTNGWSCMPDNPVTPGPDPMCMDANAMEWAMAWMGRKTPPAEQPGLIYMLAGGTDASNTDPYATKPTEGEDWVQTGPHLMLVGSQTALKGYPSGAKPDTKVPYIMWQGTPYAHLMIPTS